MKKNDFRQTCQLPRPIEAYFVVPSDEYCEMPDLERVHHLAYAVMNGWDMEAALCQLLEEGTLDEDVLTEALIRHDTFLQVHGDWKSPYVEEVYNHLYEDYKKPPMRWKWKDYAGILCSDLKDYVHWTETLDEVKFSDELKIVF